MTDHQCSESRLTADLNAVIDSVMDRVPDASVEEVLGPACERINTAYFEPSEIRTEPELAVRALEELIAWLDTEITALTSLRRDASRIEGIYFSGGQNV